MGLTKGRDGSCDMVKKPFCSSPSLSSSKKTENYKQSEGGGCCNTTKKSSSSAYLSSSSIKTRTRRGSERNGSSHMARESSSSLLCLSKETHKHGGCDREDGFNGRRSNCGHDGALKLQPKKLGPLSKSSKKAATVVPELEAEERENVDLDNQFLSEKKYEEDSLTWLSSDSTSPSRIFEGDIWSSPQNLYNNEWLVSWLLTSRDTYPFLSEGISTFFDGSTSNFAEEGPLVPEQTIVDAEKSFQQDLRDVEVLSWPESADNTSFFTRSSDDFTASDNSSSTTLSPRLDLCLSWNRDLGGLGRMVSLLNPEGEDTESELDCLQPGFHSSSSMRTSMSSTSFITLIAKVEREEPDEHVLETAKSDGECTDEPIFWPFQQKFDLSPGSTSNYFCMSPLRNICKAGTKEKTVLTTSHMLSEVGTKARALFSTPPSSRKVGRKEQTELTTTQMSRTYNQTKELKEGLKSKRQLVFSPRTAAPKGMAWKKSSNQDGIKINNGTPSRLDKPMKKALFKTAPLEVVKVDATEAAVVVSCAEKMVKDMGFLKEDLAFSEGLPIEALMGLDEYDGNVGVDIDFDKDDFSLDLRV